MTTETAEPEAAPEAAPQQSYTIEPDGTRVRKLLKPITGHNGLVNEIRMRQPTFADIMRLGDPSAVIVVKDGFIPQEDISTIRAYVESLVMNVSPLLLANADYRDALALKQIVLDFFKEASTSN